MKWHNMNNTKVLIFFFVLFIPANTMELVTSQKKHIVIDHTDFIFEPNSKAAASQIGWLNICSAFVSTMLGTSNIQDFVPEFFTILSNINPQTPPNKIVWQRHNAPYVFYEYLTGKKEPKALLAEIQEGIKNQHLNNESLMLNFAQMSFDPKVNTNIMKTIFGGVTLLEELRKEGHTIHCLGNWNKEAAETLKAKHQDIFRLFNGQTIFSGDIGIVKSPEMYKEFFKKTNAKPEDTIFIETEPSNTQHLMQLNTNALPKLITCQKKDFLGTRQKLIEFGALPKYPS